MISKQIISTGLPLLLWLVVGITTPTAQSAPLSLGAARELFLEAESALSKGKLSTYQKLKKSLTDYPLFPYLLYMEYGQNIPQLALRDFQSFMDNYSDTPLAEQLRSRWLHAKAKQEDWQKFLKAYQPTEDIALQCHYLWASLKTGGNQTALLAQASPLWLNGKQPPKSCEALFRAFEKSNLMTRAMVWQRIKLAIQEGNESLARRMARYLKKPEVALVELWLMVHNNPYLVTHQKYFTDRHPAYLEMLVHGVSLIAKTKPERAIEIWQQIGRKYPFAERHWGLVVRAIGIAFALQKHPEAEKWLSKTPDTYANQLVHEWRIRVALAKEDWPSTLRWLKNLPDHLAKNEEWQYWHARTLEMLNRREESQSILSKLAKTRSYYGFLASHHLLRPHPNLLNSKTPVESSLIQAISQKASILRAKELHTLRRFTKAKAEWQFITNKMTDKEKHAAAHIAIKWNLPNWAILALSKANNKNDLALRFPLAYAQHILQEAQKHKLDPAWILAITRQESAFVPHAKSYKGALGLMQLIPSTAQMVARKKRILLTGNTELLDPYMNIQLGSGYLKMMLDQYRNNPVLATAAYNAGPGRIPKWLPNFDMAADLWIETIPIKETREYVKNVMTYTAIYQELLGKKPALQRYMAYIPSAKH